jgi:nicotinamidase-related amidase
MKERHPNLLDAAHAALVIVDLQEAFRPTMADFARVAARTAIIATAAKLLKLPILVTEQYPQKLGATVAEVRNVLPEGIIAHEKAAFSSCGAGAFVEQLKRLTAVRQLILCGIEAHVCMNQTAHDLLADGYQVHLCIDCTSSRHPTDRDAGLAKMQRSGVLPCSSEMAVFELMRDAKHEHFKAIQKLIK